MADQFPSGLGAAKEMYSWLPCSDIFSSNSRINRELNPLNFTPQSSNSIVDQQLLAQRFAACTLPQRTSRPSPPFSFQPPPPPYPSAFQANLENFRTVGFENFCSTLGGPYRECGFPTGGVRPVQSYPVPNPVQSQGETESMMVARGRNLNRETGWFLKSRIIETRIMRIEGGGGWMERRGSANGRGYGGTGVFLPDYATNTPLTSGPRKRSGTRTRQVNQSSINRCSLSKAHTRKEEECHLQLPPEALLPQEWTY